MSKGYQLEASGFKRGEDAGAWEYDCGSFVFVIRDEYAHSLPLSTVIRFLVREVALNEKNEAHKHMVDEFKRRDIQDKVDAEWAEAMVTADEC